MKSAIRNVFLVSCLLFAAAFDCCTKGVEYDREYQLYPETAPYSCMLTTVYGMRWQRSGSVIFWFGTAFLAAAMLMYHRDEEGPGDHPGLSILATGTDQRRVRNTS